MENISANLLKQYFAGECTDAEQTLVEEWLNNPQNSDQVLIYLEGLPKTNEPLITEFLQAKNEVWENITKKAGIKEYNSSDESSFSFSKHQLKNNKNKKGKSNSVKIAVVLSGLLILILVSQFYLNNKSTIVKTAYGQVQKITLPDRSVVYLNGNSQLTYKRYWHDKDREVWLEGEGYFKVAHLKNHQNFTVHLSNKMDIEVLGTEFNVLSRKQEKAIVLKSGKIKLNLLENKRKNNIYLKPGDLVTNKDLKAKKLNKKVVDPELYYAWVNNKWVLDNTPLEEMLLKLEETYGITAIVKNEALIKRRASGSIPLSQNNVQTLINDIANIFELSIQTEGDTIYLEAGKQPKE